MKEEIICGHCGKVIKEFPMCVILSSADNLGKKTFDPKTQTAMHDKCWEERSAKVVEKWDREWDRERKFKRRFIWNV